MHIHNIHSSCAHAGQRGFAKTFTLEVQFAATENAAANLFMSTQKLSEGICIDQYI